MKSLRVLPLVLALAAIPFLADAAVADGQPQTVTITTAAPTGTAAIYDRVNGLGSYVPLGTSTSGLPVYFSVTTDNPDSPACFAVPGALGHPGEPGIITIYWNQPGVCHVHANQPGDEQYGAAPEVVQDVVVHKEISHLTAPNVSKGLLGLSGSTFTTTLKAEGRMGPGIGLFPVPGEVVIFKVAGKVICSATTNNQGVATCKKAIGVKNAMNENAYTVSFGGNAFIDGTTSTGRLA